MFPTSRYPDAQAGAGSTLVYLGLTAVVIAGAVLAFLALREGAEDTATAEQMATPAPDDAASQAEPPPVKPVDFQDTDIEELPQVSDDRGSRAGDGSQGGASGSNLFERGGKARPLTDGLAGGSEAPGAKPAPEARVVPNAVDAFDYGVLDGRVRIGVFGKGGIADYKASVSPSLIVIQMPGDFRYVEEFSRTLNINQFGVSTARLARDSRGMRMSIVVTPELRHQPFLIEDPKGLMVAFEPKR